MSYRRRDYIVGIAIWFAVGAVIPVICYAVVTPVTVPLVWPAGVTVLAGWLLYALTRCEEDSAREIEQPRTQLDINAWHDIRFGSRTDLIGDRHRDTVLAILRDRYADGYLTPDEIGRRQTLVLNATRCRDLTAVLEGLQW